MTPQDVRIFGQRSHEMTGNQENRINSIFLTSKHQQELSPGLCLSFPFKRDGYKLYDLFNAFLASGPRNEEHIPRHLLSSIAFLSVSPDSSLVDYF